MSTPEISLLPFFEVPFGIAAFEPAHGFFSLFR